MICALEITVTVAAEAAPPTLTEPEAATAFRCVLLKAPIRMPLCIALIRLRFFWPLFPDN